MRTLQRPLQALFLVTAVAFLSSGGVAQDKASLPPPLNQNSSLSEVLGWLDRTALANARVELKDGWDSGTYRPPWDESEAAKGTWILSRGFRLTNIDGCTLTLKNDDVKTFSKSMEIENPGKHFVAELYVPLNRLGPTKGRSTYRFTNDPDRVRLLGAWRTKFEYKGLFSRPIVELAFSSTGPKETSRWESENLAFTFDSKEMSEKFDAAFRQAIRLCQGK